MRLNSKVAVAIAAAMLVLGMSVVSAIADAAPQQTVALDLAGSKLTPAERVSSVDESGVVSVFHTAVGAYGDEVTLQPTVLSAMELPNDVFHFQVLMNDVDASGTPLPAPVWKDFSAELDIKLEDTNTVLPMSYVIGVDDRITLGDGTLATPVFPYTIRCEYKPLGASSAPASYSETETVGLLKNLSTKVTFAKSGTTKRAGTAYNFRVSPNCGVGTVRVTVAKSGSKTLTYNLTTDEDGRASATLKLGSKNGVYKVSAKFLGNVYGVASKTLARKYHAYR